MGGWKGGRIDKMASTFSAENVRRLFGIARTLYKWLKADQLNYRRKYWGTRKIAVGCPRKPTEVTIIDYLNMFSSWNSTNRNNDVAYMAEETGW